MLRRTSTASSGTTRDMNIAWGIDKPLVSEKDARYTKLSEMPRELLPRYSS